VPDDGTYDVFVHVSSIEGFRHGELTDASESRSTPSQDP